MDVFGRAYETFEQLRAYCYRVASVVGLVSIEIFGYQDPGCRQYAVDLGLALQLTNIIRDIGVDLDNGGRIYLPLEDLERFGYRRRICARGCTTSGSALDGVRGRSARRNITERAVAGAPRARPARDGGRGDHAGDLLADSAQNSQADGSRCFDSATG